MSILLLAAAYAENNTLPPACCTRVKGQHGCYIPGANYEGELNKEICENNLTGIWYDHFDQCNIECTTSFDYLSWGLGSVILAVAGIAYYISKRKKQPGMKP